MPFGAELARSGFGRPKPVERFRLRSIDRQPALQRIFNNIDEMFTPPPRRRVPPRDPASSVRDEADVSTPRVERISCGRPSDVLTRSVGFARWSQPPQNPWDITGTS
jgi:hypothetical protein